MTVQLSLAAVFGGLWVLIWSSDRFVVGAAGTARHLGLSPMIIGMVIVGFGTSAPEMVVSAFSALQGNPSLALGNAYGSNIANIALILGVASLVRPIKVHSKLLRQELPLLTGLTVISYLLVRDFNLDRADGWVLLAVFAASMTWTVWMSVRRPDDRMVVDVQEELPLSARPLARCLVDLLAGLVLLMASSRLLVWGAVNLAELAGVSDLVIGLTIVAIGTSLPELASTIAAVKKGEHDLALGNVVGSNIFNTLAVVGIASCIHPFTLDPEILTRDFPVMGLLTLSLFLIGWGRKGKGVIQRWEGAVLLAVFVAYTVWLASSVLPR